MSLSAIGITPTRIMAAKTVASGLYSATKSTLVKNANPQAASALLTKATATTSGKILVGASGLIATAAALYGTKCAIKSAYNNPNNTLAATAVTSLIAGCSTPPPINVACLGLAAGAAIFKHTLMYKNEEYQEARKANQEKATIKNPNPNTQKQETKETRKREAKKTFTKLQKQSEIKKEKEQNYIKTIKEVIEFSKDETFIKARTPKQLVTLIKRLERLDSSKIEDQDQFSALEKERAEAYRNLMTHSMVCEEYLEQTDITEENFSSFMKIKLYAQCAKNHLAGYPDKGTPPAGYEAKHTKLDEKINAFYDSLAPSPFKQSASQQIIEMRKKETGEA